MNLNQIVEALLDNWSLEKLPNLEAEDRLDLPNNYRSNQWCCWRNSIGFDVAICRLEITGYPELSPQITVHPGYSLEQKAQQNENFERAMASKGIVFRTAADLEEEEGMLVIIISENHRFVSKWSLTREGQVQKGRVNLSEYTVSFSSIDAALQQLAKQLGLN